jgi:hypothetical protein
MLANIEKDSESTRLTRLNRVWGGMAKAREWEGGKRAAVQVLRRSLQELLCISENRFNRFSHREKAVKAP